MAQNYTAIDELIKKYQAPAHPVSYSKESEPLRKKEAAHLTEVVEHEPHEEVKPFVTVRSESIELPPDLSKMGLQSVQSTSFPTYKNVKLPLSDDKIVSGMHAPITSSLRWLATLAWYMLLQAHLTLRVIHGKVIRVARRG